MKDEPDQQKGKRCQAAVNRIVAGDADLKVNIEPLHNQVDGSGDDTANQRRGKPDPGVGY